jgi:hypothetical protein
MRIPTNPRTPTNPTSKVGCGLSALAVCAFLTACGGSSSSGAGASPAGSSSSGAGASPAGSSTQASGAGALAADAKSAATGDIPDNQNFLTYRNASPRFSIVYPEGWTVKQAKDGVTFRDKNNLVRIAVALGVAPTLAAAQARLTTLKRSDSTLTPGAPRAINLKSGPAVKVTYTTRSAPNPVTGKSVTLTVDRYELAHGGQVATIDLGTPTGVDNVDAYKKMVASYRWG